MTYLLKKSFVVFLVLFTLNIVLAQLMYLDAGVMRDMMQAFVIAIVLQPFVVRHLEG